MEEKSVIQEGLDKGYLLNKRVYVKPLEFMNPLAINKKDPRLKFMLEGCKWAYMLGLNERGELLNPFDSEEERKYFEKIWNRSLNHRDLPETNYWSTKHAIVYIEKSQELLAGRFCYDLSIPEDNLRWRILKSCKSDFANGKEDLNTNPYRKFVLIEEGEETNEQSSKLNDIVDLYVEIAQIKKSKSEMIKFLTLYYAIKKTGKYVPENNDSAWYEAEIMACIDNDFTVCKKVLDDKDRYIKRLFSAGLTKGAVERVGVSSYRLPGMSESYTLDNFIKVLSQMKEETDPLYLKLEAQVESTTAKKKVTNKE